VTRGPAAAGGTAEPGLRLGRYVLQRRLAEGAFGDVWEATLEAELGFRKPVALKLFKNTQITASLVNEARLGARLHHPNVVDVYEIAQAMDGAGAPVWFLAMELLDGETVEAVVARHPDGAPPELATAVVAQIAQGLQYAHGLSDGGRSLGLVHRDLKPANVMWTAAGVAKILDFGIAVFSSAHRDSAPRGIDGTPCYLAPEQASGRPPTPAADVWALGAIAVELATGRPLVAPGPPLKVLAAVSVVDPDAHGAAVGAKVQALGPLVARCLQPDPARRPSAAEVVAALAPAAPPAAAPAARWGWGGRAVAAALAAALLGTLAWLAWPRAGGTLVVGLPRERGTLDPFGKTRNLSLLTRALVWDLLTEVDADGEAVPRALAGFRPSPDDRTWTFVARDDLVFQPGPCTASGQRSTVDDLAYTLDRAREAGAFSYTSARIVGDAVELGFDAPRPFAPQELREVPLLPASLAGCDDPRDLRWPVGTGAWRFEAPPGERLELVPHRAHVALAGEPRPRLERLVVRTLVDADTDALLRTGELHVAERFSAGPVEPPLAAVQGRTAGAAAIKGLVVLRSGPRPLDDAAARRALAAAIPRDLPEREQTRSRVEPASRWLQPAWLGWDPGATPPAGDLAALQAHGELTLGAFASDRPWADAIGRRLGERGVDVQVVTMSLATLEEATTPGGRSPVDLALVELHGRVWGTDPWPWLDGVSRSLAEVSYLEGEAAEALHAGAVRDRTARRDSYRALERAMLHDVPMVPLGWLAPVSLAHAFVVRPEVVGFADDGGVVTGDDALVALGRAALR
jgi:hypothetical protein